MSEHWWLPPLAAAFCDIEQLRKSLLVTAWRDNSGETASLQDSGEIVTVLQYWPHKKKQVKSQHSSYSWYDGPGLFSRPQKVARLSIDAKIWTLQKWCNSPLTPCSFPQNGVRAITQWSKSSTSKRIMSICPLKSQSHSTKLKITHRLVLGREVFNVLCGLPVVKRCWCVKKHRESALSDFDLHLKAYK